MWYFKSNNSSSSQENICMLQTREEKKWKIWSNLSWCMNWICRVFLWMAYGILVCMAIIFEKFIKIIEATHEFAKNLKSATPAVEITSLLYGLQRSGRTSILYKLKLDTFIPTIPTVETIEESFDLMVDDRLTVRMKVLDVGRRDAVIPTWRRHHWKTDSVIFVVDSREKRRISEARDELLELMFEDHYRRSCSRFLILANKQDVVGVLSRKELETLLCLPNEMKDRWRIIGTSAVTGQGLKAGIRWLAVTCGTKWSETSTIQPSIPSSSDGDGIGPSIEFHMIGSYSRIPKAVRKPQINSDDSMRVLSPSKSSVLKVPNYKQLSYCFEENNDTNQKEEKKKFWKF